MKNLSKGLFTLITLSMIFIGCGGGSSSNGGDNLSFPSNAVSAAPTLENGQKVKDAITADLLDLSPNLNSIDNNSNLNTALLSAYLAKRIGKYIKISNMELYSLNRVSEETEECSGGGTAHKIVNGDEINGGYVIMTANDCNEDGEIIDGSTKITFSDYSSYDNNFKIISMKFTTDFITTNLSNNSVSKISKNSYMDINIAEYRYEELKKFTISMSMQRSEGTKLYGMENCIFHFDELGIYNYITTMYQTEGKIYINNLASYVEYDKSYDMSATPFLYSEDPDQLISGEARYNMSNNGKVKIIVESNEAITYVDADGDGFYELRK